jgi:hypothetical protein
MTAQEIDGETHLAWQQRAVRIQHEGRCREGRGADVVIGKEINEPAAFQILLDQPVGQQRGTKSSAGAFVKRECVREQDVAFDLDFADQPA